MKRHPYRSVLFDLDGTLIDSAPGILACFSRVLEEANLQPVVPLSNSLIGPPLRQALKSLTGLPEGEALEGLAVSFREIYDAEGHAGTRVYPGVEDLLARLASEGIPLAIATNKRRTPTLKIVEQLGWKQLFRIVGTLDTPSIPHAGKGALLGWVVDQIGADAGTSLYLGDKWEDGEAAAANGMPFFAAGWGYGDWDGVAMPADWRLVRSPRELAEQLEP